jgi:hypothetical protein
MGPSNSFDLDRYRRSSFYLNRHRDWQRLGGFVSDVEREHCTIRYRFKLFVVLTQFSSGLYGKTLPSAIHSISTML